MVRWRKKTQKRTSFDRNLFFSFRLQCPTTRRSRMAVPVNNNKPNRYIIHSTRSIPAHNHIHHRVHHQHRIPPLQRRRHQMKMNREVKKLLFDD